jgi:hypothetical protein
MEYKRNLNQGFGPHVTSLSKIATAAQVWLAVVMESNRSSVREIVDSLSAIPAPARLDVQVSFFSN